MAWIGSAAILFVVMSLSRRIKNVSVILIIGMMLGSAITALVGILQYMGTDESLKAFIVWTMGSLSTVTIDSLKMLVPVVLVGTIIALATVKPLNMLNIGENYARTMGLNIKQIRFGVTLTTVLLAGTITAYCGPIGFIGLAVPHVARMMFREADLKVLVPATMLTGAAMMLLCDVASTLPAGDMTLPINTISALVGIPIVVVVIVRNRKTMM
jgi:iron complex transport system permease protein